MSFLSSLFGGKAPTVSTAAPVELEKERKKARRSRVALLETEGGIRGEELQPGQVSTRNTLFGN